ncbi:hypothetical protein [Methanosarcina barkeri]|nr:hypothetical protein [Methanosarcina barkeri]
MITDTCGVRKEKDSMSFVSWSRNTKTDSELRKTDKVSIEKCPLN